MPFVSERDIRYIEQRLPAPEEFVPESIFTETIGAAFQYAVDEDLSISSELNREGFKQRQRQVRELVDKGEIDIDDYLDQMGDVDYDMISAMYPEIKSTDQLDEERSEFLAKRRERNKDVIERGSGLAQFIGMAGAFVIDPINIATMPLGFIGTAGRGMSVLSKALTVGRNEAMIATAAELGIQGFVYSHKRKINSPYTMQDAATNIAAAAAGAGILGTFTGGLAGYLGKVRERSAPMLKDVADDEVTMSLESLRLNEEAIRAWRESQPKTADTFLESEYARFVQGEVKSFDDLRTSSVKQMQDEITALRSESMTAQRWVSENGGLNQKAWSEDGFDVKNMREVGIKGAYGKPFFRRKGGMTPDALAEKLVELMPYDPTRPVRYSANDAIDWVDGVIREPEKLFDPDVEVQISGLERQIDELMGAETPDAMESIYRDGAKRVLEQDRDQWLEWNKQWLETNEPSRVASNYETSPRLTTAQHTLSSREREILDELGIADDFDADMEAYYKLPNEERVIVDPDTGDLVSAEQYIKRIDDDINGIESVMRCVISA